ncbi:hypothetical protein K8I61_17245 [bacterium]|nr:hypothetical protein [bacterium]
MAHVFQTRSDILVAGGVEFADIAKSAVVSASAWARPRTLRGVVEDGIGDLSPLLSQDAPLSFAWTFDGERQPIFSGKILKAVPRENFQYEVFAADAWNLLQTVKFTRTFESQTVAEILRTLVGELGIDTAGIAESEFVIDKLPLNGQSVAEAIAAMDLRAKTKSVAFLDENGVFTWTTRTAAIAAESSMTLYEDGDLLDIDRLRRRLVTFGRVIEPAAVIDLAALDETVSRLFAANVETQIDGRGSRVIVDYEWVGAA